MINKYPRLYALYVRNKTGGKRWERVTSNAYPRDYAAKIWQPRLLNSVLEPTCKEMRLRPID